MYYENTLPMRSLSEFPTFCRFQSLQALSVEFVFLKIFIIFQSLKLRLNETRNLRNQWKGRSQNTTVTQKQIIWKSQMKKNFILKNSAKIKQHFFWLSYSRILKNWRGGDPARLFDIQRLSCYLYLARMVVIGL